MKNEDLYLSSMTPKQFEHFKIYSCEMYARVSPHYREMPFAEALKIIVNDFNTRFAPEGLDTPGQFFIAIMKGDSQVGYFHFSEFPKGTTSLVNGIRSKRILELAVSNFSLIASLFPL